MMVPSSKRRPVIPMPTAPYYSKIVLSSFSTSMFIFLTCYNCSAVQVFSLGIRKLHLRLPKHSHLHAFGNRLCGISWVCWRYKQHEQHYRFMQKWGFDGGLLRRSLPIFTRLHDPCIRHVRFHESELYFRFLISLFSASVIVVVIIAGIVVFSLRKRCNSRKMLFDRFGTIDPMPKDILEFLLMSGAPHKKLFDGTVVFKRSLSPEMQSYRLAIDLLESLDGKRICDCIVSVHGVVNPRILNNFDGFRSILVQRFQNDPALFRKVDWMSLAESDLRANVIHHYGTIVQKRDWNKFNCLVPIVPVVHGTDLSVAWKIVNTGFSALSSLDAGFYGRGIYFSSSALYTLPYYASKPNPCLILCLAIPGNVYPVVENHQGSHSLLGLPIKAGYQSNYVLTTKDGRPCTTKLPSGSFYDELVLDQEAQVVPIAIIEFDAVKLAPIAQNFQREIARM